MSSLVASETVSVTPSLDNAIMMSWLASKVSKTFQHVLLPLPANTPVISALDKACNPGSSAAFAWPYCILVLVLCFYGSLLYLLPYLCQLQGFDSALQTGPRRLCLERRSSVS